MTPLPFKSAIEKHVDSAIEEQIFGQVAREMHSNEIRPGLWAKAFAESNGDPDHTRARYISLRANSIVKEVAAQHELLAKTAAQTEARIACEQQEKIETQRRIKHAQWREKHFKRVVYSPQEQAKLKKQNTIAIAILVTVFMFLLTWALTYTG